MPRDATQAPRAPQTGQDDAALLAEMRARVEEVTAEIERLTSELTGREEWVDELETIVDLALGLLDVPVVVVGDDRRIRALSRGASEHLGSDAVVGKPLSSVVPDDVFAVVDARIAAAGRAAGESDTGSAGVDIQALPGGGAIMVFEVG